MRLAIVLLFAVACGGHGRKGGPATPTRPLTLVERMMALLPDGVQVLIEVDLDRLRGNAAVGPLATKWLASVGAEQKLPGLPVAVQGSPLADASYIMLASYGVGTAQAATVTILVTKQDVPNAVRVAPDLVVLGPAEWVGQIETRAGIAAQNPIMPSLDLMPLRDHAMPAQAPGATLRVTARLSFDARVALARQLGVDTAPAQLSIWGDVVDDLVIIVDADAADPGDPKNKDAANRLTKTLNKLLVGAAREPAIRALGLPATLNEAKMVVQKTWVRTILEVGPHHLARVVERARAMLGT